MNAGPFLARDALILGCAAIGAVIGAVVERLIGPKWTQRLAWVVFAVIAAPGLWRGLRAFFGG